uniref:Retrotransposon gag domain-containing protein n=1 Tax=Trichuris muris TaxID=70415 RepID=A0A5S6QQG7_TRIMR
MIRTRATKSESVNSGSQGDGISIGEVRETAPGRAPRGGEAFCSEGRGGPWCQPPGTLSVVMDVDVWLGRLHDYLTANAVPQERWVATLKSLVDDKLYKSLRCLGPNCTYEECTVHLRRRFGRYESPLVQRLQFSQRLQNLAESIQDFADELRCLGAELGKQDDDLKDQFIMGLRDTPTQRHLVDKGPTNFDEAIAIGYSISVDSDVCRTNATEQTSVAHSYPSPSERSHMASYEVPNVSLLPKTEVYWYRCPTEEIRGLFLTESLKCLNGKWCSVAESNGMYISMLCSLYNANPYRVFDEECYDLKEVIVDEKVLASLDVMHEARKYSHSLLPAVNLALSILLIGKDIGPTFQARWRDSRAKSLFNTLRHKWDPTFTDQLLSLEWATAIEAIWDNSHALREDCFSSILAGARYLKTDKKFYRCVVKMLRFARITGFYLVREYVINDRVHRILDDPYLQSDKDRLKNAMRIWASAPQPLRSYLGVIADPEIFVYFEGDYLHRLTYIALLIGRKSCPTLNDYPMTEPSDAARLRELVEQYFPE